MNLDHNEIGCLISLVRKDIKKKTKDLSKISKRETQSEEEFNAFKTKLARKVGFLEALLAQLTEMERYGNH